MKKEPLFVKEKLWGEEVWLVNNEYYCSKILPVDDGAKCSYHCHPKKQETFFGLGGFGKLTVEGKSFTIAPFTRPKTIYPNEYHMFEGIDGLVLLEISTHHEDDDVIRLTESVAGGMGEQI